jgi:ABC-type phosphate transport system substrate-binding protein
MVKSMKGITRMSDTTSAPVWGARAVKSGLLALALTALAAIGLASQANADFTTGKCAGLNVTGEGGSFAKDAQTKFNESFKTNYCIGTPGFGSINVTYSPEGSSAGIAAMTNRALTPRFGGTDDPPTVAQVQAMNAGTPLDTDNGKVHVLPIAVGSVVVLVNFPDGCNPEKLGAQFRTVSAAEITDTPAKKALLRVRFPKALFEEVWAGTKNAKWTEAFPELDAIPACEVPIIRVVRFDGSGTTFTLKDYLNTINPARQWKTTYATTGPKLTQEWPNAVFGTGGQCGATAAPGKDADTVDYLTTNCAKGNGQLIAKLALTEGSIGYADLATARNSNPTLAVDPTKSEAPTTPYWIPVQNGSGVFTEPTADEANGFKTAAGSPTKGSNCLGAEFKDAPDSSFGDWANTSGVNSTGGWGICTLTYALAFDDNAAVWGNTPEEEAKARTVKDYQESILSGLAQGLLFGADYAPLPQKFLDISKAGVASIGWNKTGSGGGGDNDGDNNPPAGNPPAGGGGGGATPPVISNQFSIPRKTISSKTGSATFSVKLPGAGKLGVFGTTKSGKKAIKVGNATLTVSKAGTYSLTLKPTGAAKQLLSKKGSLKVNLTFTFSPTGGVANTTTSAVTLKLVKQSGKQS